MRSTIFLKAGALFFISLAFSHAGDEPKISVDVADAFEVLGVSPEASKNQAASAYWKKRAELVESQDFLSPEKIKKLSWLCNGFCTITMAALALQIA